MQAIGYLSRREHSRQELRQKLLASLRQRARDAARLAAASAAAARELAEALSEQPSNGIDDAFAPPPPAMGARATAVGVAMLLEGAQSDAAEPQDPEAIVDQLLDWLAANKYLSETRFVESRVNARSRKQGTMRIKLELSRHGLALEPEQAAALRETEFARAQALWQRKFGELAPDARAARQAGPLPGGARLRGGRRAARRRRRGRVLTTCVAGTAASKPPRSLTSPSHAG